MPESGCTSQKSCRSALAPISPVTQHVFPGGGGLTHPAGRKHSGRGGGGEHLGTFSSTPLPYRDLVNSPNFRETAAPCISRV